MRLILVGVACVAAASAAACGGGSSSGSPAAPSGGTSSGAQTIVIVGQRDAQSYTPNPSQAGGRTVVWRNDNGEAHNITATDGSWSTGDIAPGATSRAVAIPPGGSTYFCSNHPDTMRGGAIQGSGGETPECTGQYC